MRYINSYESFVRNHYRTMAYLRLSYRVFLLLQIRKYKKRIRAVRKAVYNAKYKRSKFVNLSFLISFIGSCTIIRHNDICQKSNYFSKTHTKRQYTLSVVFSRGPEWQGFNLSRTSRITFRKSVNDILTKYLHRQNTNKTCIIHTYIPCAYGYLYAYTFCVLNSSHE